MELRFTAVCMDVDIASRIASYACAAHPAPILIRGDHFEELETGGSFVGVSREAEFFASSCLMEPGDRMVLASDGAIDPMNAKGEELGSEGLVGLLNSPSDGTSLTKALELLVRDRTGGRIPDDLTVVTITALRESRRKSVRPQT